LSSHILERALLLIEDAGDPPAISTTGWRELFGHLLWFMGTSNRRTRYSPHDLFHPGFLKSEENPWAAEFLLA
jgi:hypothetical protein